MRAALSAAILRTAEVALRVLTEAGGSHVCDFLENGGEICRVGKMQYLCNFGNAHLCRAEQCLRVGNAADEHVLLGRDTIPLTEYSDEMRGTDVQPSGDIRDVYMLSDGFIHHAACL